MADTPLLKSTLFAAHGITACFTTRHGGVSPAPYDSLNLGRGIGDSDDNIDENLRRLCRAAGLNAPPHQARQVHGIEMIECSGSGKEHDREADLLLSGEPGTAVAVRTADCLPLLLADPEQQLIAAVHAGWRGTARSIATHAVEQLVQCGASAAKIIAAIGPAIGPCCFEIGEETAAELAASCNDGEKLIRYRPTPHADLAAINRTQLLTAGLLPEHIEQLSPCTCCNPDRFFSYRRDGRASGRQLAVVALPASPYTAHS